MTNRIEKFRAFIHRSAPRIFSAPYLPGVFIWLAVILAICDTALLLIAQPAIYWREYSQAAADLPWLHALLAVHPLALVGALLAYLLVLVTLLELLTRSLALVFWLAVMVIHLTSGFNGVARSMDLVPDSVVGLLALLLPGALVGAAISLLLLRPRSAWPRWLEGPAAFRRMSLVSVALVVVLGGSTFYQSVRARQGWQPLTPAHSPGSRWCAAFAYNPKDRTGLLFGGSSMWVGNEWDIFRDTWLWDGSDWRKIETDPTPGYRRCADMVYDPGRGVVILFGGMAKDALVLSDTWEWDGQRWSSVTPLNYIAPPARSSHKMFYDPARKKVMLSGGFGGIKGDGSAVFLDDTWTWDGQRWEQIFSDAVPALVEAYTVAYDPAGQTFIGINSLGLLDWQENRWMPVTVDPQPAKRKNASMAANPAGDVLLFGGIEQETRYTDTWLLRQSRWAELKPDLAPPGRETPVLFFDETRGSFVMYGGLGKTARGDMWELRLPE